MKKNNLINKINLPQKYSFFVLFFCALIFNFSLTANQAFGSNKINNDSIEKIEKAIVYIETRVSVSAYQGIGSYFGTGFINDKKNGLIVTNNHVIGGASVGSYFVTFYDGRQAQAKVLYYDIWQDYAILKVDSNEIPESAQEILFSKSKVTQNQKVFVIGNPDGKLFSFHDGHVSNLYSIEGMMPQSSYVINLNSAGGSSGSPIINEKLEAIGVLYGGNSTFILALHGQYVQNAIDSIKKSQIPPQRKHCGAICDLYSLDKAVKHRLFPKNIMEEYIAKFPEARNKAISVSSTLKGSPAEKSLQAGDIIWEINGKQIGGNLYNFDYGMDSSAKDSVELMVFRNGKKLKIEVGLYDVNKNKIERMVDFGGATFFELDDICSFMSGAPLGSLSVSNVQSGSSFSVIPVNYRVDNRNNYRFVINSIDEKSLHNLDDLIKIIPETIDKRFVSMRIKNFQPYYPRFNSNGFISAQEDLVYDIVLDSIDNKPRILKYDSEVKEWVSYGISAP